MSGWKKLFLRFRQSKSGNVAIIFGMMAVPLMVFGGASMDFTRANRVESALQSAVDATALAAARQPFMSDTELSSFAQTWVTANGVDAALADSIDITGENVTGGIKVTASADVPTTTLSLVSITEIPVGATSTVFKKSKPTELILAIDTTGSMAFGNNWDEAVEAFGRMVDTLKVATGNGNLFVTFLPFSDRVNVGTDKTGWVGAPAPWPAWQGCLEPREVVDGSFNHALNDDSPTSAQFNPSAQGYYGPIGTYRGNNIPVCPDEIEGPTENPADIETALNSMSPSGTGRFDLAMAWAWRLISPNWQGEWNASASYPSNYGERDKVVVFLSDGHTVGYEYEVFDGGESQPWGYNNGTPAGFEHMVHVCNQMKANEGVTIHTIFVEGNNEFIPYMQQCATDSDHYHAVEDLNGLLVALSKIENQITELRVAE